MRPITQATMTAWERQCRGKVKHPNEKAAKDAVGAHEANRGGKLNAYKCSFCEGWHIGHELPRFFKMKWGRS